MRRIACALALAAACKPPPAPPQPPPVLDEIVARYKHASPLPHPDEVALAGLARDAIAAAKGPLVYTATPDARAPRGKVRVDVELAFERTRGEAGTLKAELHARIAPRQEGQGPLALVEREGLVEKEGLTHAPTEADVRAHLARAFALIVTSAMRGEQLWLAPAAEARATIGDKDAELRDEAIRIAGERRDRAATPLLLPLLKSEDAELRDRTIGALAEIGDPSTVKPLAELAKFGDLGELPKILDAIERVGGPEAVAYLEFVSTVHPSEEIRDEAKRDLEHLRARNPTP